MFKKTKDSFYQSLGKSIEYRKKALNLKRDDILKDERRVSKIVGAKRNKHYPYLICRGEYPRLYYLFLCEDYNSFINENDFNIETEELIKKCGGNYDKMLWGHIDWDKMFLDVITELSEFGITEDMGKLFADTLIDYAPYANIRYDELPYKYARIWIPPNEEEKKRQAAINWVHLRHGSRLFKQTFYEKFSGKTLREFDKEFSEFVSDYLEKRKPNEYSLGLQAYNFHKTISRTAAYWQSRDGVRYGYMSDGEVKLEPLFKNYYNNGREQMKAFEEYQKKFDEFHIDIK